MTIHMLVEVVGLGMVASLLLPLVMVVALLVYVKIAVVRVSRLLLIYWMPARSDRGPTNVVSTHWTVLTFGSMIVHCIYVDTKSN